MAFSFSNSSTDMSSYVMGSKMDSSQIGKLTEAGFQAIPISKEPSMLKTTQPTVKQVLPGISVNGFVDGQGNFYILDENYTVYNLKYIGQNLNTGTGTGNTIPTDTYVAPAPYYPPPVKPPVTPPSPPSQPPTLPPVPPSTPEPPLPPPPPNLGSGKIFSPFQSGDVVPNQQETITRALWSGNVGNLTTFFTSSAQTNTQKRYYYEVFNSGSGCGTEAQFSVVWGHKQGSGSADEGGQVNDTPSRAMYGSLRMLCLDSGTERFIINGTATDHVYGIIVNRSRMRESLDEGNIELNLQRLSGSFWLSGGKAQNAWTGSNVKTVPTQQVTRIIDDSKVNSATVTEVGEVYNLVSGSIENGVYNASSPHYYGLLYKRLGIMVLDGRAMDLSCSFLTVTGSEIPGDNAWKLYTAISGAARYTDDSGDVLGFQGRSSEKVKSTHYFVRVKNSEYNFTNNPSFVTGSEGDLSQPDMINDPRVYITTVGLYNERKELLAVAKLSKPLQKSFTREALVKVKLDF